MTVTKLDGKPLSLPLVTSYSYDVDGNLISTQNANGTTETPSYHVLAADVDRGHRVLRHTISFAYTYDPAGHVLTETDTSGRLDTYSYDSLYRVTQQSITDPSAGNSSISYSYDLVSNRLTETTTSSSGQQTFIYNYDINDRLMQVTGPSGYLQTYSYDSNGNTLTVAGSGGASSATYTWSPTGLLQSAVVGTNTISYTYDTSGNRTSETTNSQTTTYLNDPNQAHDQVLEEYAPGGVLAATYVRGLDLLFQDRTSVQSYYLKDGLGSTRGLASGTGAVTDTYNYDAFGNLLLRTGSTPNEYLFARPAVRCEFG